MPKRPEVILFFLINLLLCSWHLDVGHNDNVMSRAAFVASVVHHGELKIDRYHEPIGDKAFIDGHYYSDKAPLPSLLATPVYWCLLQLGLMEDSSTTISDGLLRVGGFVCGSIPLAIIITLVWLRVRRRQNVSQSLSGTIIMLSMYGSFLFVYSGSFQAHLLGAALLLIAVLSVEREHYVTAGLFAGAAFLCEYTLLLFIGIWGLQLLFQRKLRNAILLGVGAIPAILFTLWYNHLLTGDALTFTYKYLVNYPTLASSYGFRLPSLKSLWGLSLSPYRGLLFYTPVLLVLIFVAVQRVKKSGVTKRWLLDPFLLPSLALFIAISMHSTWWAGWTYGPRYLMASAVLLLFVTLTKATFTGGTKWILLVLSIFGFACSFIAKSTLWYDLPTEVQNPVTSLLIPAFAHSEWTSRTGLSALLPTSEAVRATAFLPLFVLAMLVTFKLDQKASTSFNKTIP